MHLVLVNGLEGLSLSSNSVISLTNSPSMTIDVKRQNNRCQTRTQQQKKSLYIFFVSNILFNFCAFVDRYFKHTWL